MPHLQFLWLPVSTLLRQVLVQEGPFTGLHTAHEIERLKTLNEPLFENPA
jgi:hypothetical protein